ncbi:MAG TPA: carboxymuconolactone decarboxylase family protein [Blastocatellia bacterium]|nr:carboxymuconolactone decarboxylase family protein [Blastocatellia bacterium]
MRLTQPRLEPLAEEKWDDETRELLERLQMDGRVFNIFRTLAVHPKLLKRWLVFGNHILYKSSLPPRERELLILRTGWLCRAEYEWGQHVVIGKKAGLSSDEINRIKDGPDAPGWSEQDATLLRAADELHSQAFISDPVWNALAASFDAQQLIDLIFTVGQYNLVSMALNTLGVQLDEDVMGFES